MTWALRIVRHMARPKRDDTLPRVHYIPEWADRAGLSQADLVRLLGVDKGTVSRWFAGTIPTNQNLIELARAFGFAEVATLFTDPAKSPSDAQRALLRIAEGMDGLELEKLIDLLELRVLRSGTPR